MNQIIMPHGIEFGKCFKQMNRTVLIFVSGFGSCGYACRSLYRRAVSLHVLVITFVHGIMTVLLHPHECLLYKIDCIGIVGKLAICFDCINAECISVSILC